MTDEEFAFKLLSTFNKTDIKILQERKYFGRSFVGHGVLVLKPLTYCGESRKVGDYINYITGEFINRKTFSPGPR